MFLWLPMYTATSLCHKFIKYMIMKRKLINTPPPTKKTQKNKQNKTKKQKQTKETQNKTKTNVIKKFEC